MKVSIIIPSLNEENFLPFLLEDLASQTTQPHEIIVVDAGSEDRTAEMAKSFERVKLITTPPNIGAQRTTGGRAATGDFLFFLDADTRLKKDFIERALTEMQNRKVRIACPHYVPYSGFGFEMRRSKFLTALIYEFFNLLFYLFQKITPSGAGSGIVVHKDIFEQIEGFSPNLKFDDIDFIRRGARVARFGKLDTILFVSDRRFVRYGALKMLLSYLVLSLFFIFGAFKSAEVVEYKFSDYTRINKSGF